MVTDDADEALMSTVTQALAKLPLTPPAPEPSSMHKEPLVWRQKREAFVRTSILEAGQVLL
jgi:hypothetical protein